METKRSTYRLDEMTLRQIKQLRERTGLNSDAKIIALAVDRLTQQEK